MIGTELQPYKIVYVWTVAYAFFEPFVALVNYLMSKKYGMKTMFQLYSKTSPFLIVACEYVFMTITLVKTMYVYKHILKKPSYYPEKDSENAKKDYRDFILVFIAISILLDIIWSFTLYIVRSHIPFLSFLNNYSHELGWYSVIRPVIFGITLLMISDALLYHATDVEAIGIILFSLFTLIVASF